MTTPTYEFGLLPQETGYRYFDLPGDVVPPVSYRDPIFEPYPEDWYGNTGVGDGASFTPAGLGIPSVARIKTDGVTFGVYPNDPTKPLTRSTFYYNQDGTVHNVPSGNEIPKGVRVYVPPTANGDGKMNEISVFVDTNGKLYEGQPMLLDQTKPSTDPLYNPRCAFFPVVGADLYTNPTKGGHGGSHMPAFGLTIRDWEFRDLSKPLGHAVAINLPPRFVYRYGVDNATGFRAPAISADGGWDAPASNPGNNRYTGTVSNLKMGALLSWVTGFDLSSITDPTMHWFAQGIYDYGAYLVDVTGFADVLQVSVEKSIEKEWLALPIAGSNQLWSALISSSFGVVSNNGPGAWGGGGIPRVPTKAPLKPKSPPPPSTVALTTVLQSTFADPDHGVASTVPGSIFAKNDAILALKNTGFDWSDGAVLHGDARPDPSSGSAWHGAPWDWTINGILDETLRYHSVWYEVIPTSKTGLPKGVRVQICGVESWVLNSALTVWTKTRSAVSGGSVPISGAPAGGYFQTTGAYKKVVGIEGWDTGGNLPNGGTYQANPGAKWRTELTNNGGGYSIDLDPISDASGAVIDDLALLHGQFRGFVLPNRVLVPSSGYNAWSGWMRLIMNDGSPVPSSAKYVGCLGSDIYNVNDNKNPSTARGTSQVNPRHIILTSDWKWLGHVAGSKTMIQTQFPALPFVTA